MAVTHTKRIPEADTTEKKARAKVQKTYKAWVKANKIGRHFKNGPIVEYSARTGIYTATITVTYEPNPKPK